jgi:CHAT domain-containing protein/Tfp pilus assembly protein PilF
MNRFFRALLLSGCLLPLAAAGEDYLYEGQITFKTLTGKDCGDLKAGDSLAIELAIRTQPDHLFGFSRLQGSDPGQFGGTSAARLNLLYPEPEFRFGNTLALEGVGNTQLTGTLAERALAAGDPGCSLSLGDIEARRTRSGSDAANHHQLMDADFRFLRDEHEARTRAPEAYAEILRIGPEAEQASKDENGDPARAVALLDSLQPLYDKVYGTHSEKALSVLVTRARLLERMRAHEPALALRRAALERTRGNLPKRVAIAAFSLGDLLETLGRKEEALVSFTEARRADEQHFGADHMEVADDLVREAVLLEALGRRTEALPARERVVTIRLRNLGRDDARTGKAIWHLAKLLMQLERYEEALTWHREELAITEKRQGARHADTAASLEATAVALDRLGRYAEIRPLQERVLAIRLDTLGAAHPDTATAMANLGMLHLDQGEFDQALPLMREALAITEKARGPDHANTGDKVGKLAQYHTQAGQYDAALLLHQRALAIAERALGPDHPGTADELNLLANVQIALGQYEAAKASYLRALDIRQRAFGASHSETRILLNNLAHLYQKLGEYEKALPPSLRALAIAESKHGSAHPETAKSLNNLAALYSRIGQTDKALPLARRALDIYEKALGPDHALTATAMTNLASHLDRAGHRDEALSLTQRALAVREQRLGENHPDAVSSLNNLGYYHWRAGAYEQASARFQRALAASERAFGAEHDVTAGVLNNLAVLYGDMGRRDDVLPLLRRAQAIDTKTLGASHPQTGNNLANLAFAEVAAGQHASALASFSGANAIADRVIERVFAIANEKEKLAYVRQHEWSYFGQLSLIHRHFQTDQPALRQGLNLVLARKGVVFDAQARQNEALAGSLDTEDRVLWDELSRLRARQAQLTATKPDPANAGTYRQRIEEIDARVGELERRLADRSALVAQQLRQRDLTHAAIAGHLPANAVLAEFIKINDYDWFKGKWSGSQRYLAFLLHPDKQIELIDLGDADALENALREPLRQLDRIGLDGELQLTAARKLHQVLWQPLAQAAGAAGTVVFSPDGLLNLVPFAAMLDDDERFFIEHRTVVYVTSGRELARASTGIQPDSLLYLVANPAFESEAGPASGSPAIATRSAGFNRRFEPLPGTQEEADYIPGLLPGKQRIVTGRAATESSVLGAGRPKVMHLATHGFFLADQPLNAPGTRGAMALVEDEALPLALTTLLAGYENPLLRSGLALAGANHAGQSQGADDGLLTALEVSGMSLHGTDLVTLSACETGRGDVQTGEGVFGLRRAFALSGAKHLVMSLWPVGDEATAQQMRVFYRQYGSGARPAEALRAAQLASIEALRAQGKAAEPALWAPFIAQGW